MNKKLILGYLVGPIGSGLLGIISLPLITWFYSVEDVGRVSMLQVVMSLFVLVFCLGLDQFYVREYYESKNKPTLFKAAILPGALLALGALTTAFFIDRTLISRLLYAQDSEHLSLLTLICLLAALLSRFFSLILRMQERSLAFSMAQLLPKVFFLLFIVAAVCLNTGSSSITLVSAHTLSIVIVLLVFMWNTKKDWREAISSPLDIELLKRSLHFGLPLVIAGIAVWGLNVMDKLFLRYLSTLAELGVYSVTMSFAGVATLFAGIFNLIWAPLIYKWVHEDKVDIDKLENASSHFLAIVYFTTMLSVAFSWVTPLFLPQEYEAIAYLLPLCLLHPLLYTLSEIKAVGITIVKKTKLSMYASVTAMVINFTGNYLLVPNYGALGAAVSTSIAFGVFFILRLELSSLVWVNLRNTKSYIVTSIILIFLIANGFVFKSEYIGISLSLFFLIGGFFLFKGSFLSIIELIKNSNIKK
ncbi:lipopolysaccharide biosynthesis protein [Pseudoalteromonas sp. T1lg76]|uniref:lipopolysaccharide biosynthesis protein n=1 Tax=Pseudoalteromonas sp. T1lg76 TaxID=2077103 RepID=UPI000CF63CCC|nr:oligosaccharide flippase family protein [Pseudoalteromonas sp. T1lg76]